MLIASRVTTAAPAIDAFEIGIVNSRRRIRHRVVLRHLEVQLVARRIARLALDHVDAAGVGAGDVAALLQDRRQQPIAVALARDRARNLDQFAALVAVARELADAFDRVPAQLGALEQAVHGQAQHLGRGVFGQERDRRLILRHERQPGRGRADQQQRAVARRQRIHDACASGSAAHARNNARAVPRLTSTPWSSSRNSAPRNRGDRLQRYRSSPSAAVPHSVVPLCVRASRSS